MVFWPPLLGRIKRGKVEGKRRSRGLSSGNGRAKIPIYRFPRGRM